MGILSIGLFDRAWDIEAVVVWAVHTDVQPTITEVFYDSQGQTRICRHPGFAVEVFERSDVVVNLPVTFVAVCPGVLSDEDTWWERSAVVQKRKL